VILGIPGETHADMMETAEAIGALGLDAVKLHNLYAVHGTPLGEEVLAGEVAMMERDAYVETVVDFLERIPPEVVVERVSGDAPPDFLIAPRWCLEKSALRREIEQLFAHRGTRQGDRYRPNHSTEGTRKETDQTPPAILQQINARGRLPVLKIERPS